MRHPEWTFDGTRATVCRRPEAEVRVPLRRNWDSGGGHMKLEKWALIAEIVGGVAIVASLAMLIYETRQNTAAIFAANYDQLSADLADWRLRMATSPGASQAYFRFLTSPVTETVSVDTPDSDLAAQLFAVASFQIYERAYFARRNGRLGDDEWDRFYRNMCDPVQQAVWGRLEHNLFSTAFVRYLDACAAEP